MNYLQKWTEDLLQRQALPLHHPVHVQGIRDGHTGPRWEFAKIVFVVEPVSTFEVQLKIPQPRLTPEQTGYIDQAVFGFLDVVMTSGSYPFKNVRLTFLDAQFDPIRATASAFRKAGRDAGRKFLDALREPRDA